MKVDVGDYLSINNRKRLVLEEFASVVERATGTQDLRLFLNVTKLDAKLLSISQRVAN